MSHPSTIAVEAALVLLYEDCIQNALFSTFTSIAETCNRYLSIPRANSKLRSIVEEAIAMPAHLAPQCEPNSLQRATVLLQQHVSSTKRYSINVFTSTKPLKRGFATLDVTKPPAAQSKDSVLHKAICDFKEQVIGTADPLSRIDQLNDAFQRSVHDIRVQVLTQQTQATQLPYLSNTHVTPEAIRNCLKLPAGPYFRENKDVSELLFPTPGLGLGRSNAFNERSHPEVAWTSSYDASPELSDPSPSPIQLQDYDEAVVKYQQSLRRSRNPQKAMDNLQKKFVSALQANTVRLLWQQTKDIYAADSPSTPTLTAFPTPPSTPPQKRAREEDEADNESVTDSDATRVAPSSKRVRFSREPSVKRSSSSVKASSSSLKSSLKSKAKTSSSSLKSRAKAFSSSPRFPSGRQTRSTPPSYNRSL